MDGGDSCSDGLNVPRVDTSAAHSLSQTFDQIVRTLGLDDQCSSGPENDDPQLPLGAPGFVPSDAAVPAGVGEFQAVAPQVPQVAPVMVGPVGQSTEKRRRGRPPKGHTVAPKPPPPPKKINEEEDVCFICFDGGSLVLCDRKGCPKAYHPACIKRDEAFFRSKAKWNCGWHICSVCQKAAHYMCYTCTYSLCKGCAKDADFVCVRGNKGFCTTCMKTIMLIENKDTGSQEMVQVDFDDKTSWEYLFKVYWVCLRDSLSLTINELLQARSPWRGVAMADYKPLVPTTNNSANGSMVSISVKSSENSELDMPREPLELPSRDVLSSENTSTDNSTKLGEHKVWASKELLDLVAHMKNGDTSALSPFDVQSLLLEYIKRNNLRDPRRKSQIICDIRLRNLFGKHRVGHIEMLKLLEYHFLIKEDEQNNAFIPAGIVSSTVGFVGADQDSNLAIDLNKKRKTRKKAEEKAPQMNLDEFAAIDVHNIGLIYLRRNLIENLFGDEENFRNKVVGSFVRIRVSSNDQRQDIYRLVQVVGTSKAAEPYKLVDKTTDVMLEVLNLNKKEMLRIDEISDQEFSQEECRRLRQIIRCGLVKRFTVGEIQTKAIALQALKLNDVLEAEILRLNHLCDRANEKGRKKDLRECVEKLQRLKTPEERQRRLTEIPEVHADPTMDPDCESEDDIMGGSDQKSEEFSRSKRSKYNNNGSQSIPPRGRAKEEGTKKVHCSNEKWDAKHEIQVSVSGPGSDCGNHTVIKTSTASFSSGSSSALRTSEMDKLWHYRDPNGKVQGPFAMMQLRKWSTTGYFPPNMRIWTVDELNGSMLLNDALNEQVHRAHPLPDQVSCSQDTGPASNGSSLHSFNLEQAIVQQVRGSESEEFKSVLDNGSQSLYTTAMDRITSGQSIVSSNGHSNASQSSGHNSRPFVLNLDLNQKDSGLSVASITTPPNDSAEQHGNTDMSNLPSPTPKMNNENLRGHGIQKQEPKVDVQAQDAGRSDLPAPIPNPMDEDLSNLAPKEKEEKLPSGTPKLMDVLMPSPSSKPTEDYQGAQLVEKNQSGPSKVSVQDAGPSWGSCLGVDASQLQEVAPEWSGYPAPPPRHSVDGWGSGLVSMASVKPDDILGHQVTIPNLNTNQLVHSSVSNISSWQAVHEPIEFSTLAEESVSDLLAEVDAMESQSGLASPTSGIKLGDEMMDSCRNDCFSSIEELSPNPDAGKSDAVSSGEVQFPSQSPVVDDPGVDSLKRSDGHSATSSEGETRSAHAPRNAREHVSVSDIHKPPEGSAASQGMDPTPMTRNRGLEPLEVGWPGLQGNMNMGWGGSPQGFPNIGWGSGLGGPWGNPSFNLGAYSGGLGWDSPRRYGGDRFATPRDWGFQGAESVGYGRGRPMWSRQPHGGGGGGVGGGGGGGSSSGGGGYSRSTPKGQRVCKFYESGHCKKGASCDYLHP